MAPKKDKAKVEEPVTRSNAFSETEKAFYDLQIADCNRKLARLRATVIDYEIRNEELQEAYEKLDIDRADIIAYLKKTLALKNEENNEMKEKIKGLEETRERETAQFKETVTELEKNFTTMKDQLTSEIKLLSGKLNTLEEFRAIRDDLMRKFDKQERDFKDQEMKYKRVIYDTEKKFVIGKDKLKKEMEARLLQLAQDFQDATELRIAASTHRVIRENIAINNELDSILNNQSKISDLNEKYKESEREARVAMELAEEERDKAINKNVVQLKVIDQLTLAFQEIKKEKALYDKKTFEYKALQAKLEKLTKENDNLTLQVRILEQNLHANLSYKNVSKVETNKIAKETIQLKQILKEAAVSVKTALKVDNWAMLDPSREIIDRQALLSDLLKIITQYHELETAESVETVASMGKIYEKGDLGFIPKPQSKSKVSLLVNAIASKDIVQERESVTSSSLSESSICSLQTVPSKTIVPITSKVDIDATVSESSFASSAHTTESTTSKQESEDSELNDVEKQLEKSKADIQRSIMKDLAISNMAMRSQVHYADALEKEEAAGLDGEQCEAKASDNVEGEQKSETTEGGIATEGGEEEEPGEREQLEQKE